MGEGFRLFGEVIVDDVFYLRDVQAAGGEVRRDENVSTSIAEFTQHSFAFFLFHSPVEILVIDSFIPQVITHFFRPFPIVTKNQGRTFL